MSGATVRNCTASHRMASAPMRNVDWLKPGCPRNGRYFYTGRRQLLGDVCNVATKKIKRGRNGYCLPTVTKL